jgi:hypothetical protein
VISNVTDTLAADRQAHRGRSSPIPPLSLPINPNAARHRTLARRGMASTPTGRHCTSAPPPVDATERTVTSTGLGSPNTGRFLSEWNQNVRQGMNCRFPLPAACQFPVRSSCRRLASQTSPKQRPPFPYHLPGQQSRFVRSTRRSPFPARGRETGNGGGHLRRPCARRLLEKKSPHRPRKRRVRAAAGPPRNPSPAHQISARPPNRPSHPALDAVQQMPTKTQARWRAVSLG